jgi:hypothetical protein
VGTGDRKQPALPGVVMADFMPHKANTETRRRVAREGGAMRRNPAQRAGYSKVCSGWTLRHCLHAIGRILQDGVPKLLSS